VGSLDEHNPSLWVATSPRTLAGPDTTDGPVEGSYDVVVIGGGITGLTTARLLAREAASVAVLESDRLCSGVTAYTTAKVTALQRTVLSEIVDRHGAERAAMYAEANRDAVELVAELTADDDIACGLERAPACTYTETRPDLVEAEHEACTTAGLATRLDALTELPFEVDAAVWLDDQVQLHPRQYCLGLAEAIERDGGAVFEGVRALDVDTSSEGCVVTTNQGVMRSGVVVMATLLPFVNAGAFFARAHAHRSHALAVHSSGSRCRGMYISAEGPTRSVRSTPDGWMVVAGESHKVGRDDDTRSRYDALETWTRSRFDVQAVGYRWSAQDYETVDGLPYVGEATPRNDKLRIATGFRKWGMSNGTAAARMLSDAILGRTSPWEKAFDATRLAPGASIRKLVSENLEVGKRFVADRIGGLHPRAADDLAPGEGDVVSLDGSTVGGYRDDDGQLHAVNPTCTHLGCRVTFNTAERSWDCPCHGSRFDVDGRVLQGPAVEDLAVPDTP
jgi:glycine/D-amino acid oxidase-like deaminating enzyme/nitrite reductase/ring-hydroxylating ferredoxin subunit